MATTKSKKIFIAVTPGGSDQSLFFRLWKLRKAVSLGDAEQFDGVIQKAFVDMQFYAEQMSRQQVHVDEIKRMCHVPIRE